MATWYETPILRTRELAPNVRQFWIENPGILFNAGQFITLDLPIGEKRLQRWRSYSIASAPSDTGNEIELCIVRSSEGLGTQYLFEEAKEGTILRWKGPDGGFVLPNDLQARDLVLICTGTGLAPFRSMVREIKNLGVAYRSIHLIFGCRTEADILYRTEMEALAKEMPHFHYDVALSRQNDWQGYKGYVHPIYQTHYPTPRPDVLFMICGWSQMIDEAVANLLVEMRFDRNQVVYELYG
jgi:ferredoxin-NADP reductase